MRGSVVVSLRSGRCSCRGRNVEFPPRVNVSGRYRKWPVFSRPLTNGRFWVSTEVTACPRRTTTWGTPLTWIPQKGCGSSSSTPNQGLLGAAPEELFDLSKRSRAWWGGRRRRLADPAVLSDRHIAGRVTALVLPRFVKAPVRIKVATGSQRPVLQNRLGSNLAPACAGQLHSVADQIDDASGDRTHASPFLRTRPRGRCGVPHRDVDAVHGGGREVELLLGATDKRDPLRQATCTVPKAVVEVVFGWRSCRHRCERSTSSAPSTGPAASSGLH